MGYVCWERMLMGIACGSPRFCFLNQAISWAQNRSGLGSISGRVETMENWSKQVSCLQDHHPSLLWPISVASPVISTYHSDRECSRDLLRSYLMSWHSNLILESMHATAKRGGTYRVIGLVPIGHVT
ncbi:hypothetical protein KVT40_003952 [Elsinoe batatas]|uniref:Uncharacterized protein n=1 Tax=Elsinoe batatas TaxID=2601811 RepID=A0A8K0PJS8_9PEZI|nr:hypothetical protein KVT40_003952 [Elsinoe batatas]